MLLLQHDCLTLLPMLRGNVDLPLGQQSSGVLLPSLSQHVALVSQQKLPEHCFLPEPQSHTPGPVELLHVRPVLQSLGVLLPQQTSLKLPLPSWMHWPAQQVLPPEQSESSSHSAQLLR